MIGTVTRAATVQKKHELDHGFYAISSCQEPGMNRGGCTSGHTCLETRESTFSAARARARSDVVQGYRLSVFFDAAVCLSPTAVR